MSHHRALPAAALAVLALAACSPSAPTAGPTEPAPASSEASHSPAAEGAQSGQGTPRNDEPGLDATRPINADNWMSSVSMLPPTRTDNPDKALVLTAIRASSHEVFTRVVLEFDGEGSPGVRLAQWSDQALEQGRGLPIEVAGAAVLELILDGTPMTATSSKGSYPAGEHTRAGDLDIVSDGTCEDNTHVVIGAPAERPCQIGFLSNPSRVVIDIRN